ncbi:MAG: preprotein translocase subunit SecE [Bacteroidota bacterium]|nr:preprotein translocase subunit SecE [Bacteroidota bacterium]
MKDKIINFVNDVVKEMRKVTWPTREELQESTMVVIAAMLIIALFIAGVDWVMTMALNLLLGT